MPCEGYLPSVPQVHVNGVQPLRAWLLGHEHPQLAAHTLATRLGRTGG